MKFFGSLKNLWFASRLILISFSIMAVFSIFLHDHEFDPGHPDENCAPCHWTHTTLNAEDPAPEPETILTAIPYRLSLEMVFIQPHKFSYNGRSPPAFS